MSLVTVYKGRTKAFTCEIHESDGTTAVVLQQADTVRCKIGRADGEPSLDLSSDEPVDGHSTITFTPMGHAVTITLTATDTDTLEPGAYDGEILVYDYDEDEIKSAGTFVLSVLRTMGGDVGGDDESSSSS